jgi:hypothetical protein
MYNSLTNGLLNIITILLGNLGAANVMYNTKINTITEFIIGLFANISSIDENPIFCSEQVFCDTISCDVISCDVIILSDTKKLYIFI